MAGTGRARVALRAALIASATIALLVSAPTAGASEWFGYSDMSVTNGQLTPDASATWQAEGGATSARVVLDWDWVQHTDTTPNFSTFDAIYQADLAHGIHPIFELTGAPPWTWATGDLCLPGMNCNYPPAPSHDAAWKAIAADIAQRYPQLAAIAIWQEPNETWAWAGGADPARYTQLLQEAYGAIKAVAPSMPVLGGDLAADLSSQTTSSSMPLPTFLRAMYSDGAKGSMDGIALHPYPNSLQWWYVDKAISTTSQIRDDNGDSVPLWITETGASTTGGWSWTDQALIDSNLVRPLLAYPGIAGVYINQLMDADVGPYDDWGYGVLTTYKTPKPAFCDLVKVFSTGYRCPLTTSSPQPTKDQQELWQAQNLLQYALNAALEWRAANGTYTGLTSADLNSIDSRISATPANGSTPAGSGADPAQIGVYPMSATTILLCNASQSTVSYCIYNYGDGEFAYGKADGSIYAAAHATIYGQSQSW